MYTKVSDKVWYTCQPKFSVTFSYFLLPQCVVQYFPLSSQPTESNKGTNKGHSFSFFFLHVALHLIIGPREQHLCRSNWETLSVTKQGQPPNPPKLCRYLIFHHLRTFRPSLCRSYCCSRNEAFLRLFWISERSLLGSKWHGWQNQAVLECAAISWIHKHRHWVV